MWCWAAAHEAAFEQLKQAMCSTPVLAVPDFTSPFAIETDELAYAAGGVLTQHGRPIAFYSKSLASAQCNYPVHDRE